MKYFILLLVLFAGCKSVENKSDSPLELNPDVRIENNLLKFSLKAKRNFIVEKEYLPTSEELRIIISDKKGRIIYQSNQGMNYFQVVEQVKPIEIDDTYTYELASKIPSGMIKGNKYSIQFIIPAKPQFYIKTFEYEYK